MKKFLWLGFVLVFLLASCAPAATAAVTPAASETVVATTAAATVSETSVATAESTAAAVDAGKLVVYAPASTSSIPVILAVSQIPGAELTLYSNQSQANTLFLRGDVDILVTGLSVGVDMANNGAPVQMVDSFVSGLSYLVTYGQQVSSLADLKGQEIYIPFEGSPIEEVTAFFAQQEGLTYKTDLTPIYAAFDSSVPLLKQGKATAVVLPEPNVTLVEGQPNVFISVSYFDEWNRLTGTNEGYPQVGAFVNSAWAADHAADIAAFNTQLAAAITSVEADPAAAVTAVSSNYKLTPELLLKSLNRTRYNLVTGQALQDSIENYYQTIGKPLDEKFTASFFGSAQ
jgi:NitT/TauT family transport system substrate-binding protein